MVGGWGTLATVSYTSFQSNGADTTTNILSTSTAASLIVHISPSVN